MVFKGIWTQSQYVKYWNLMFSKWEPHQISLGDKFKVNIKSNQYKFSELPFKKKGFYLESEHVSNQSEEWWHSGLPWDVVCKSERPTLCSGNPQESHRLMTGEPGGCRTAVCVCWSRQHYDRLCIPRSLGMRPEGDSMGYNCLKIMKASGPGQNSVRGSGSVPLKLKHFCHN